MQSFQERQADVARSDTDSRLLNSARTKILVIFPIFLCLIDSPRQANARYSTKVSPASQDKSHFRSLRSQGYALYQTGKYSEAAAIYENGYRQAEREGEPATAMRFLNNLAGCRFALFEYRAALKHYLEAQRLAGALGDTGMYGTLTVNISSMRLAMGETELAARGLEQGLAALRSSPEHADQLLIQLGWIHAQSGNLRRALPYFRQGLEEAGRRGDTRLVARGLDHLGYEYLRRGELNDAEPRLIEAYRMRVLSRDPEAAVSYPKLGMLRHAQGDLVSASNLLDRALASAAAAPNPWPLSGLYHQRALVRRDQGRAEEALEDFRAALAWARRWRAGVLPSDAARTASGAEIHKMREDFLAAAAAQRFNGNAHHLTEEMFQAAEEQRAASLRESIDTRGELSRRLPPEYAEKLAQLRAAEFSLLRADKPGTRATIETLRHDLSELETNTGLGLSDSFSGAGLPSLGSVQNRLRASQALLSFHAGSTESYLWAITAQRSAMYRLAGKDHLQALSQRFTDAVSGRAPESDDISAELYHELFGSVEPFALDKPEWLLVLDAPLFHAPVAALVVERAAPGKPVYLIERHSIRILPGSWAVLAGEPDSLRSSGGFVGIGDGVYNSADPRWGSKRPAMEGVENARLAATAQEIEACARAYGAAGAVLLKGWDISRRNLESALEARPEVLHIAGHVLRTPGPRPSALIHLGLGASGKPEALNPADIVTLRGGARVVVLSGCASGSGESIPGEGLMGLTRAWLMNGAAAVAATYWPITDDTGEIFLSFYRHLSERGLKANAHDAGVALQTAQLDMLGSGGWRANPRYWAAFFVIGRS